MTRALFIMKSAFFRRGQKSRGMTYSDTSEGIPLKLNMLKLSSQQQMTPQILLCLCLLNELVYKCHLAASSQTFSSHLVRLGSTCGLVGRWIVLSCADYLVFLGRIITAIDISCVSEGATNLVSSRYLS